MNDLFIYILKLYGEIRIWVSLKPDLHNAFNRAFNKDLRALGCPANRTCTHKIQYPGCISYVLCIAFKCKKNNNDNNYNDNNAAFMTTLHESTNFMEVRTLFTWIRLLWLFCKHNVFQINLVLRVSRFQFRIP
jgi:hypothetical protein